MATTTNIPTISQTKLEDNITFKNSTVSDKFYSSALLNYVESVEIAGYLKTVFYTEISTNLNVGDRIFILNGNYDSNDFITKDKYSKYTDGYRVLGVDGCRIILDIDYTGQLPYSEVDISRLINVYNIKTKREFDYISQIKIGISGFIYQNTNYGGGIYSKFEGRISGAEAWLWTDSIAYFDASLVSLPGVNLPGVTTTGFYIYQSSTLKWVNITNSFLVNKLRSINPDYNSNGDITIIGEDITFQNQTFLQRAVYKFKSQGTWIIDIQYQKPYISRLNFRYGTFKGKHKDGIFGTILKRNNWNNATWTSGVLVNSSWNSGTMTIKSLAGEKMFTSKLSMTGMSQSKPVQTIDISNNRGFGFSFFKDSNFLNGTLEGGNFENCNIGDYSTLGALGLTSSVDIFYGLTHSHDITINRGKYVLCDIFNTKSTSSTLINSNIYNSNLLSSQIVNSQVWESAADKSEFNADSGVKVISADMWSYDINQLPYGFSQSSTSVRGVLKLYISDEDLKKFHIGDAFYISKVNKEYILSSLNGEQKINLPIETKFILDNYFDKETNPDVLNNSYNKLTVSVKTTNNNKVKYYLSYQNGQQINNLVKNDILLPSIDIEGLSLGWYYDYSTSIVGVETFVTSYKFSPIAPSNVKQLFTGTILHDADFKSGIFNNGNWTSGESINYIANKLTQSSSGFYVIQINYVNGQFRLNVRINKFNKMNNNLDIFGQDLRVNDNVWINSVDLFDGTKYTPVDGRYKILSIIAIGQNFLQLELSPQDPIGLTGSNGYFLSYGAQKNNYNSISKFIITNSRVKGGLFKRTGLKSNIFSNQLFNNFDKELTLSNIEQLRLVNILFKNTNNTIQNGIVYQSHFVDGSWQSGIAYNSIWNGSSFGDGLAIRCFWDSGVFQKGTFMDSREFDTLSSQTYEVYNPRLRNWKTGTFNSGEFYNSVWVDGNFNGGRIWYSDWYGGIFNGGIAGSKNIDYNFTTIGSKILPVVQPSGDSQILAQQAIDDVGNTGTTSVPLSVDVLQAIKYVYTNNTNTNYTTAQLDLVNRASTITIWNNGLVENAKIGGDGVVYWYGGKFNDGEFTSNGSTSSVNESIWYNGDFNGGKVTELARWKNGNFYKGKFLSYYGWEFSSPTNSSTYSTDYSWENGKFYGGEFGNSGLTKNSVWYDGEFNGGLFVGRLWYYGIFTNGTFIGSGSASLYLSKETPTEEQNFADSFTSSYYGLWYDGFVENKKYKVKLGERVSSVLKRKVEEKVDFFEASLSNILWVNGTFSHPNARLKDSVWLNGGFVDGRFDGGVFNAFVTRPSTSIFTPTIRFSTQSTWYNGNFVTGSFYNSEWKSGVFNNGYMAGAIWRSGTWNYGTAENIYWEGGLWRNGNWNGSPFGYDSLTYSQLFFDLFGSQWLISNNWRTTSIIENVYREKEKQIGATAANLIHVINGFSYSSSGVEFFDDTTFNSFGNSTDSFSPVDFANVAGTRISSLNWTYQEEYDTFTVKGLNNVFQQRQVKKSGWGYYDRWTKLNPGFQSGLNNAYVLVDNISTVPGSNDPYHGGFYWGSNNVVIKGYNETDTTNIDNFCWKSSTLYAKKANVTFNQSDLDIFDQTDITYTINLILEVELAASVTVDFAIGSKPIETRTFFANSVSTLPPKQTLDNYGKTYSVSFSYFTDSDSLAATNGKKFSITKTSTGILRILEASIRYLDREYHPTYNNTLWSGVKPFSINSGGNTLSGIDVYLPGQSGTTSNIYTTFKPSANSDTGQIVSVAYGNGIFKSGIWENGVWINGWRSNSMINETDYCRVNSIFDGNNLIGLTSYKLDETSWLVNLECVDLPTFSVGDKVSIGNIVAIDINERRRLIKDYYRVTKVYKDTTLDKWIIQIKLVTNFPIRRVIKDSDKHLIYVSNNVWLSGLFLNGYFQGVWNNGLFKGSPMITKMEDTQWIDGTFDGGHFISGPDLLSNGNSYQTGLVQNFKFIDNNSAPENRFKYLSWMDINYYTYSRTNLNTDATSYNVWNPGGTGTASWFQNQLNLRGNPTFDILSSLSTIRDAATTYSNTYHLGSAITKYQNLVPNDGNFKEPVDSTNASIGVTSLTDFGWVLNENSIVSFTKQSNLNPQTSNKLLFTDGNQTPGLFSWVRLFNTNITDNTEPNRYYMIELDTLINATNSLLNFYLENGGSELELSKTGTDKKVEYFYNRRDLILRIYSYRNPLNLLTTNLYFKNISFWEVDSIPFFNYFGTESNIDKFIKTPLTAIAPFIDYNNSNFDFIGNVNLTFDSQGVANQNSSTSVINTTGQ